MTAQSADFFDTVTKLKGTVRTLAVLGDAPSVASNVFVKIVSLCGIQLGLDVKIANSTFQDRVCAAALDTEGGIDLFGVVLDGGIGGAVVLLLATNWSGVSFAKVYFTSSTLVLVSCAAVPNYDLRQRFVNAITATRNSCLTCDDSSDSSDEESVCDFESETETETEVDCGDNVNGPSNYTTESTIHSVIQPRLFVLFTNPAPLYDLESFNMITNKILTGLGLFNHTECITLSSSDDTVNYLSQNIIRASGEMSVAELLGFTTSNNSHPTTAIKVAMHLFNVMKVADRVDKSTMFHIQDVAAEILCDDVVDQYDNWMHQSKHEFTSQSLFLTVHKQHASTTLGILMDGLHSKLALSEMQQQRWAITVISQIARTRERYQGILDEEWRKCNMELAERLWMDCLPSDEVMQGCGLDTAEAIVRVITSHQTQFQVQAQGRYVIRDFQSFLVGKIPWIDSVVNLAIFHLEIDEHRIEKLEHLAQEVNEQKVHAMMVAINISQAIIQSIDADMEALSLHLELKVDEIERVMTELANATTSQMEESTNGILIGCVNAMKDACNEAHIVTKCVLGDFNDMHEDVNNIWRTIIKGKSLMQDIEKRQHWTTKLKQIILGVLMVAGGTALMVGTGGGGGIVGRMLLSTGLSHTIQAATSNVDWKEYGMTLAMGMTDIGRRMNKETRLSV